jgi:hypothetical protein
VIALCNRHRCHGGRKRSAAMRDRAAARGPWPGQGGLPPADAARRAGRFSTCDASRSLAGLGPAGRSAQSRWSRHASFGYGACRISRGRSTRSPSFLRSSYMRAPACAGRPLRGPLGAASSPSTSSAIGGTPMQRGWRRHGLERASATATCGAPRGGSDLGRQAGHRQHARGHNGLMRSSPRAAISGGFALLPLPGSGFGPCDGVRPAASHRTFGAWWAQ